MKDLQALLDQMTLDEKIGQMAQINVIRFADMPEVEITDENDFSTEQKFSKHHLGSLLGAFNAEKAIEIQREHLEKDRNKIPMLFMRDVIHGHSTAYPIPLAMGSTFDPDLMEECCAMAARESAACGLHVTFTPMVDYVRDPRWGRVMETCGEDPYLNCVMGAAQVRGFQGKDLKDPSTIATCVKHFAGYGAAEGGRDYNLAEVSEYGMREYYLPAYKACLDAGSPMVMNAFNSIGGIPAVANSHLMKEILTEEWGFDGVVISDAGSIGGLVKHGFCESRKEAAKAALDNRCEIDMSSGCYTDYLKELLEEGRITIEQINTAVMRILKLKDKLGLFENPYHGASVEQENILPLCLEHRDIARRAAEKAAVLLKNNGVLPFSEKIKSIALIGPYAEEHSVIGNWGAGCKKEQTVTMLEGIQKLLPNTHITTEPGCGMLFTDRDTSGIDAAVEAAKKAEAVILCVGEPAMYSGESFCRTDLRLPGVQEELIKRVCEVNPNTAVVLFNGRPLVLTAINDIAPAILEMWFPGTEGGNAAARLLFGKANPSGKVTMSFPQATGQCPVYYNHPSTGQPRTGDQNAFVRFRTGYFDCGNLPLYSFGHGLSYSNFEYKDLHISTDTMIPGKTITVSIQVSNTGTVAGREVVQLYMKDHFGSTVRPVQELIDFKSVWLEPGEEKEVSFTVDENKLTMWTAAGKYDTEAGRFSLYTGCADHLLYEAQFCLVK